MEAVGLAIGLVSLTSLFTSCLDCFHLLERGRHLDTDYAILEQKFCNLQGRFEAWGRACGLFERRRIGEGKQGDEWARGIGGDSGIGSSRDRNGKNDGEWLANDVELRARVEGTLRCVRMLFGDGERLGKRYGLVPCCSPGFSSPSSFSLSSSSPSWDCSPNFSTSPLPPSAAIPSSSSIFTRAFRNRITNTSPSQSSSRRPHHQNSNSSASTNTTTTTLKWIITDHDKFTTLISHLRDFIEDLEQLTAHLGVPARQRFYVEYEIESISDVATLERIEAAGAGWEGDSVADAASLRLGALRSRGGSLRASLDDGGEGVAGDVYPEADGDVKDEGEGLVDVDDAEEEGDLVAKNHKPRSRDGPNGRLRKELNRLSAATMPEKMHAGWDEIGLPRLEKAVTIPEARDEGGAPVKSTKRRWRFFKRK